MSKSSRKTAIVTGGSSGIGLATASRLARNQYDLWICGRDKQKLNAAVDHLKQHAPESQIEARAVDLSCGDSAETFATEVGGLPEIDVLVNNAGMAPLGPMEEISDKTFDETFQLNARSIFLLCRAVWPKMKSAGQGTIVNVSSLAAVDPFPGFSIYGASKAWVDLFTTAIAAEGKEDGIRVCSVRPGAVETQLLRGLFPDFPAEQCVQPDDVAAMIVACIDQPDRYPSGEAFEVTNQPR